MTPENELTRAPYRAIAALSLAAFASSASLRVTDPLLPRLESEFGVSLSDAAQVVTAFSIAYGLCQMGFGPLGDRFGKYRVVAWACTGCALTALACALAPNFTTLVVARFLAGATCAAIIPLCLAWIGDSVPYVQRQPILARFSTGQILGLSSAQLVGGYAADHLSVRVPFLLLALWFAAVGALLLRMNVPAAAPTPRRAGTPILRALFGEMAEVLRGRWARIVVATVFLEGLSLFGVFAFIASHLHREYGVSLSAAGTLLMLFGAGGLTFAAMSHLLLARLGEVGLVRGGASLLLLSYLAIALGSQWWLAACACYMAGVGFYMFHNTMQVNATQMAPERRGAAVALFAAAFFLGQSIGVAIAGAAIERVGTRPVLIAGAAAVLILGWGFAWLRAKKLRLEGGVPKAQLARSV
jgi:predicted MFS family arabinose efflux permease